MLDALAEGDVGQVLVALSALLAGGWGPQQLATELIDDLRQVFLAALAPELCTVSGPSLERFRAVAEAMGLARVVRSMEILGHALVDMREAPDAQVVLEIGAVRAVRPDLDSGMEALSERVSVLERAQSGGAGLPASRWNASAGRARWCPMTARPPPHPSPRRRPPRPSRGGQADPSLGAVRRSKEAAGPAQPPPATTAATPPAPWSRSRRRSLSPRRPPPAPRRPVGGVRASGDPAQEACASGCHEDARSRRPHRGLGRRDPAVPPGPGQGALHASGRFVAVDEQGAHFALPNAAHREQCIEQQADVEKALSEHFGTKVALVLLVDDSLAPPAAGRRPVPRGAPRSPGAAPPPPPPLAYEVDYVDPSELEDASSDQASAAQERLLQAFPGASEVAD